MRKFWIYLAGAVLSACTVGPDFEKKDVYQDMQIAQSLQLNGSGLKIGSDWYQDFGDDTLSMLISRALKQNPTVLVGIEHLKQARIMRDINRVQYLPKLNLSGAYDYMKASDNISLSADTNYFSIGFDANWEIDLWGAGRRLNEKSEAELAQVRYSLQNIKVVLIAETASTYFYLQTAMEKLRIAKNNLALQNDIFQSLDDKYQSGIADVASYRQGQYIVQKTRALIPALEQQIKIYQNALAVLTGDLPYNQAFIQKKPLKKAFSYDMQKLFNLPADIIRTRPDVKAAEKAMVAQNAAVGQAVAAIYPNLSVTGLLGLQSSAGSKLFKSSSKAYGYEPSLTAPLFHWGALQKQIELEKQKMSESYQNYRQTLLSAVQELSNAIHAVQKEYQANRALQNAASSMRQALKAMREKYDNGLIEYATLLETQQDLIEAELSLAESNGNIYQNVIAFYKATGGGYNQ